MRNGNGEAAVDRSREVDLVGPPPDWWRDVWVIRQIDLRVAIRTVARDAPKIGYTVGAYEITLRHYDRREVAAALVGLVADGVLVLDGERYRTAGGGA